MRRIRIEVNRRGYTTALSLAERYLELNPTSRQISQLVVQLRSRLPAPPAIPSPPPVRSVSADPNPPAQLASTARPHVDERPAGPVQQAAAPVQQPVATETPQPAAAAVSAPQTKEDSSPVAEPVQEVIPPPVMVNTAKNSLASTDNQRSDDTGGFLVVPGSNEQPAYDSSGAQQTHSPLISSLGKIPRKYLMWGIPLLALLMVAIVLIFFGKGIREGIVDKLPFSGGDLFTSYDRGYGDTILSYSNRSYNDAEWEEMVPFSKVIKAADLDYRELKRVVGWTDKSYWVAAEEGIFQNLDSKFTLVRNFYGTEFCGMRPSGKHDLIVMHGFNEAQISRLSEGGSLHKLASSGPDFDAEPSMFTIVRPDLTYIHNEEDTCVVCTESSVTSSSAEDESDNKITMDDKEHTPEESYWVSKIVCTHTPKKNTAYGICFSNDYYENDPILVRFDGKGWRKVRDFNSPVRDRDYSPVASWLAGSRGKATSLITVGQKGHANDYNQKGTVYEHHLKDGRNKEWTVPTPPGDKTSKRLIAVWGVNLKKYWVMDDAGTVWELKDKKWQAVVAGKKSQGVRFVDAWVSPTGTIIAITDEAVWRLK